MGAWRMWLGRWLVRQMLKRVDRWIGGSTYPVAVNCRIGVRRLKVWRLES